MRYCNSFTNHSRGKFTCFENRKIVCSRFVMRVSGKYLVHSILTNCKTAENVFYVAHIQVWKEEINICRCIFTSSMERKIKKLYVVQRGFKGVRIVTKSLQSSCFAY